MTTPTVTELIRNGNPVEDRVDPARGTSGPARPVASIPSAGVLSAEPRRAGSHLRVAAPPAEDAPRLSLAA